MGKGQSTVEFIILISALLVIFIPMFFFISNYSIGANTQIIETQINDIGYKIADQSREMYYHGLFSKEVMSLRLPESIRTIEALIIEDNSDVDKTKYESYLLITYRKDGSDYTINILSDVPLKSSGLDTEEPGCYGPGNTCHMFEIATYGAGASSLGARDILLETVEWEGVMAVEISII